MHVHLGSKHALQGRHDTELMALSIMTFSTMTPSLKGLFTTLSIMKFRIMTLNITALCHYAECGILFVVMLSVIMQNVAMLIDVWLGVIVPLQDISCTRSFSTGLTPKARLF